MGMRRTCDGNGDAGMCGYGTAGEECRGEREGKVDVGNKGMTVGMWECAGEEWR